MIYAESFSVEDFGTLAARDDAVQARRIDHLLSGRRVQILDYPEPDDESPTTRLIAYFLWDFDRFQPADIPNYHNTRHRRAG